LAYGARTLNNWPIRTLGEITRNLDSMRVPVRKSDRKPGPYPYYGASGVVDYVEDYIFDGEYLLIAEDGENLITRNTPIAFIANGKFWVNNHAHILKSNGAADFRYIMYYLSQFDIRAYLTGSTRPKLTKGHLNKIPIPCPSLSVQKQIAHILGTLDDKIELNRKMNETLEEMARAIFKSWFVDFDPVKAKAEGRQPYGMDAETAALFPDSFQDSPLGPIPEGWEIKAIGQCCNKVQNGGTPKRSEPDYWTPGSIPWLTSGEVRQTLIIKTENTISELGLNESSAKWLPKNSTVVALYGATAGEVALISAKMTTNQAVCGLIPKANHRYFNYLSLARSVGALANLARGSAQQNISKGIVETTEVVVPIPEVMKCFDDLASPLFNMWILNLKESNTLCEVRDTLLPKLISGEISVGSAEALMEEKT